MDIETYQQFELHRNFAELHGPIKVNDRSNREILNALDTAGDAGYHPCAETQVTVDPSEMSAIAHFPDWESSVAYPGTHRDLWIVSPSGLAPGDKPGLLVFNDGGAYLNPDGAIRAQQVIDALRAAGDLPNVVGVFLSPGRPRDVAGSTSSWDMNHDPRAQLQRSREYDSLTADFSSLLGDEVLPFVEDHLGIELDPDPARRGIVGISSGGICAWTAAWHRPDQFGLVLSHCGSFTNIRGGHNWPYLIRTNERRPIRVFMQSGENDADILYGSWPLANQQVAAALDFAGYPVRFEFGTGGHNLRHGGALFAESLRWLFAEST